MIISVFDRVENIVGKGEIACASNFSSSHNVFKRLLSQRCQKVSLCGDGLNLCPVILRMKHPVKVTRGQNLKHILSSCRQKNQLLPCKTCPQILKISMVKELSCCQHFLHYHHVFKSLPPLQVFQSCDTRLITRYWVNPFPHNDTF